MNNRYDGCAIYVDAASVDDVEAVLSAHFNRGFVWGTMELPGVEVDVFRNTVSTTTMPSTDFLGWPVQLYVEAATAEAPGGLVDTTRQVLEAIWATGRSAVAACNDEDELPYAGGIHRPPTSGRTSGPSTPS